MQSAEEDFVDLLDERRKDCDLMWASRPIKQVFPHKLPSEYVFTRKQAIEAVMADPKVLAAVHAVAAVKNVSTEIVLGEAHDMLQEMASKAHLPTVRWLGLLITKVLKRILISIRLNEGMFFRLKHQMCISQVQYIYAPTHRSYLDFVLLSYILFCYDMALPNIASGMDFYRMKVVGEVLRNTGAFYMRRTFSTDPLYKEIFRSYVSSLVSNSDRAIEFFIEGTRSRSQKTLTPKFGLLSTILDGLFRSSVPDIQFIPISISYDKPLEELLFVYELLGVPKPAESTTGLFRSLSILREPFANGHVYLKIAPPISARKYLDWEIRKASALSPQAKLPHEVTKKVAYAIIDCHKRNTILTPFNLVALLFNHQILSQPGISYSLQELIRDYCWIKGILKERFDATINPTPSSLFSGHSPLDADRNEVIESLNTHKDLIEIDSEQNLRLRSRHSGISQLRDIKGYPLMDQTLRIAVPAINLMIYVNPVFAYLSKSAITAVSLDSKSEEASVKRYSVLRSLLSAEFALPMGLSETELLEEWEFAKRLLRKSNSPGRNNYDQDDIKLQSVMCSLLVPYVASLFVLCKTLTQWENSTECAEKAVVKECQRRVEQALYEQTSLIKHPYSLSLDVYVSLLSSLVKCGNVTVDKNCIYKPNKPSLQAIVNDLEGILKHLPSGSYISISSTFIPQETPSPRAKL
ncbi:hypothetical protein QAD02_005019 [Eretmocerus hayati]|uniref:Uncharacterized protein n=1 Tax=Eretmocerus hayati TaxID=131215 RepID=A0ACC2NRQ0_9HYME|nr:hypothetical protein QAD02_005019 [Eretmocerus hayati]